MFKIIFHNQNKVYELFCRQVRGSDVGYGFVEVREWVGLKIGE